MKSKRRFGIRGLVLEQLESRRLLAGNVSASRSGSTLNVRGDDAANEIAIFSVGDGEYTIEGINTDVNGDEDATFSGIRSINVELRGGDDIVTIADDPTGLFDAALVEPTDFPTDLSEIGDTDATFLAGSLTIRTNSGNDTVALAVDVNGTVNIWTGAGSDRVDVLQSDIGGSLNIRTEDGADGVTVLDSFVGTTLLVELGTGADGLLVQTFDADQIVVNGGKDGDEIGLFDIAVQNHIIVNGQQGDDDLEVEFAEANFIQISGGDGNDEIDSDGNEIFGTHIILGGNGSDDIEVEPNDDYTEEGEAITSVGGALVVDAGGGDDSLEAELVEARSITLIGGSGNDELDVDGVDVSSFVIVNAGSGNDDVDVEESDDEEFDPGVPSDIGGFLQVLLGGGDDEAFIENTFVGQYILVDAGAGNDFVVVQDVDAVDFVLVLMGAGNDALEFFNVNGSREELDGGPGTDELLIDFTNGRRIRNFEDVEID